MWVPAREVDPQQSRRYFGVPESSSVVGVPKTPERAFPEWSRKELGAGDCVWGLSLVSHGDPHKESKVTVDGGGSLQMVVTADEGSLKMGVPEDGWSLQMGGDKTLRQVSGVRMENLEDLGIWGPHRHRVEKIGVLGKGRVRDRWPFAPHGSCCGFGRRLKRGAQVCPCFGA